MSITDELRKYARGYETLVNHRLLAIADSIDAEHEQQLADAFETRNSAENLEADGWIRLPVDESGEVIRIGDRMDEWYGDGWHATAAPVDTMELSRKADGSPFWMVRLDTDNRTYISPKLLRHHRLPTVEDVLREFIDALDIDTCVDTNATIAEYAEKLRLKGDA